MTAVEGPPRSGATAGGVVAGAGRRRSTPRFLLVTEYYATLFRHFWRGSIVTILISPVLYLLAMGVGVGSLIDGNAGTTLDGTPYLHYVAPGLMAAAAMQTAVNGSLFPVLASVKWLRTAHGVMATPIRPVDLALGMQTWLVIQMLVAATVFVAIMAVAGAIGSAWVLVAPPAAALGGLAYSTGLSAWAIGRESEASFPLIFRLGVLPSFLLSGTFFPIEQLPGPLRALASVSPLWHAVELVRGATTASGSLRTAAVHLGVLGAYAGVGLWLAARAYAKRLHQ